MGLVSYTVFGEEQVALRRPDLRVVTLELNLMEAVRPVDKVRGRGATGAVGHLNVGCLAWA